jgi:hypothetical protein
MGNILGWFYFLRIFDQFGPKILDGPKAKKMFFPKLENFLFSVFSKIPGVRKTKE